MKTNLPKIIVVFTCLFLADQIKAQVTFASQEYIDNATAHNSLYNTVTGDNQINPGQSSGSGSDYEGAINNGMEGLNNLLTIARNARDLYDALPGLSAGACSPDFSTNAQSMVPSSCPDANCSSCYTSASNELNFVGVLR